MKIVRVVWLDAWIDTKDISIKKARRLKPIKRSTVGYLVANKKNCVIMATDRFYATKEVNAPMVIPRGMIIEYSEISDD